MLRVLVVRRAALLRVPVVPRLVPMLRVPVVRRVLPMLRVPVVRRVLPMLRVLVVRRVVPVVRRAVPLRMPVVRRVVPALRVAAVRRVVAALRVPVVRRVVAALRVPVLRRAVPIVRTPPVRRIPPPLRAVEVRRIASVPRVPVVRVPPERDIRVDGRLVIADREPPALRVAARAGFVSPDRARCLFTMRAATSFCLPRYRPSFWNSCTSSPYSRSRRLFAPLGIMSSLSSRTSRCPRHTQCSPRMDANVRRNARESLKTGFDFVYPNAIGVLH